jgi:hypothetical protein
MNHLSVAPALLRKGIFIGIFLLMTISAFGQSGTAVVQGSIRDPATGYVGLRSFVHLALKNTGGNQCRVNGVGLISPDYIDIVPNSTTGNFINPTVYGNDAITCGATLGATYYGITVYRDGRAGVETPYIINSGVVFDLNTASPISTNPVGTLPSIGGGGTVTSFGAGNLAPLFTTSVVTGTTTPTLSFVPSTFAPHTWFGNATGSTAVPTAGAIDVSSADITGTLAAARFPALTGDCTTSAGSLATTLAASIPGTHTFVASAAKAIYANTAISTQISNSSAETVVATIPIKTAELAVGTTFKIHQQGLITQGSGTFILRLRWTNVSGAIIAATPSYTTVQTGQAFVVDATVNVWTIGASGTVMTSGTNLYTNVSVNPILNPASSTAAVTVDTTANVNLVITAQFGTASGGNTYQMINATAQRISP